MRPVHSFTSATRASRSWGMVGAVTAPLACGKQSTRWWHSQASLVVLPVEMPERTDARALGSAIAVRNSICWSLGLAPNTSRT